MPVVMHVITEYNKLIVYLKMFIKNTIITSIALHEKSIMKKLVLPTSFPDSFLYANEVASLPWTIISLYTIYNMFYC